MMILHSEVVVIVLVAHGNHGSQDDYSLYPILSKQAAIDTKARRRISEDRRVAQKNESNPAQRDFGKRKEKEDGKKKRNRNSETEEKNKFENGLMDKFGYYQNKKIKRINGKWTIKKQRESNPSNALD